MTTLRPGYVPEEIMKERPILFNAEMVRAILDGRKTQTRRICRIDSLTLEFDTCNPPWPTCADKYGDFGRVACPYGQPGDRLWVRETFFHAKETTGSVLYKADQIGQEVIGGKWGKTWKPSIHMPRWASRITLEIVNVRVERLQDISEKDCDAEVFGGDYPHRVMPNLFREHEAPDYSIQECFERLWEQINGPGAWDKNPFVWVLEFKRI